MPETSCRRPPSPSQLSNAYSVDTILNSDDETAAHQVEASYRRAKWIRKHLITLLRYKLRLDPNGWAITDSILAARPLAKLHVSLPELLTIVPVTKGRIQLLTHANEQFMRAITYHDCGSVRPDPRSAKLRTGPRLVGAIIVPAVPPTPRPTEDAGPSDTTLLQWMFAHAGPMMTRETAVACYNQYHQ